MDDAWFFDETQADIHFRNKSCNFQFLLNIAQTQTKKMPSKNTLYFLQDYDKQTQSIPLGSTVGFYSLPMLSYQHIFNYSLLSLTATDKNSHNQQAFYQIQIPELLSYKHIQWLDRMGINLSSREQILLADEFNYLMDDGHISQHPDFQIKKYPIYSALSFGLSGMFGLLDDDELENTLSFTQAHQKYSIVTNLLAYLTQDNNISQLRLLEKRANCNFIARKEQLRAYACLHISQQNIDTVKTIGIYRGIKQLIGKEPYFYLEMDENGFCVAERLLDYGFFPKLDLLPALFNSLQQLRQDGRLPEKNNYHLNYISNNTVLGKLSKTSYEISKQLTNKG